MVESGSRTFGTLLLNCLATLSGTTTSEAAVEAECFKDLERGLPRAKLLAELAPYCDELHEEGLDKEDTVTEAVEVVQTASPVTPLLAVTPAPAAAVVDVKGPGAPA